MTSVMVVKICHVWGLNESKISTLRAFRCLKFPGRSVHWLAAIALWPFDTRCEFSAGDFHGPKSLQIGKTWDLEIFKSRILDSEEHNSRIFLKYVFSYCEMARYIYIYKSSSRYLPEKKIYTCSFLLIYLLSGRMWFVHFPGKKIGCQILFPNDHPFGRPIPWVIWSDSWHALGFFFRKENRKRNTFTLVVCKVENGGGDFFFAGKTFGKDFEVGGLSIISFLEDSNC